MSVKRYGLNFNSAMKASSGVVTLSERENGEVVRYEDYAALLALVEKAPHAKDCDSHQTMMVGGVSMDMNIRPNVRAVPWPCTCWKAEALREAGNETAGPQ